MQSIFLDSISGFLTIMFISATVHKKFEQYCNSAYTDKDSFQEAKTREHTEVGIPVNAKNPSTGA